MAGLAAVILDVRLGKDEVWPVATLLHERGIPILFQTGNINVDRLKQRYLGCEVAIKPITAQELTSTLGALLPARLDPEGAVEPAASSETTERGGIALAPQEHHVR